MDGATFAFVARRDAPQQEIEESIHRIAEAVRERQMRLMEVENAVNPLLQRRRRM